MSKLPILRTKNIEDYEAIAGNLALDFANTLGGNRQGETREYLGSYADLLLWAKKVAILSGKDVSKYTEKANAIPDAANACLERAKTLRETIYRVVTAPIYKREVAGDLFFISTEASAAMNRAKIISVSNGFSWQWSDPEISLDRPLWSIARSAADLITSPDIQKVRECDSRTCTWVFLDTSKNHTRRWCVMKDCGNREKVRRHRERASHE